MPEQDPFMEIPENAALVGVIEGALHGIPVEDHLKRMEIMTEIRKLAIRSEFFGDRKSVEGVLFLAHERVKKKQAAEDGASEDFND